MRLFAPVVALGLAACATPGGDSSSSGGGPGGSSGVDAGSTAGSGGASSPQCRAPSGNTCRPFGVDLDAPALDDASYWDLVTRTFDATYFRPAPVQLLAGASCDRCAAHGLKLVLVIENRVGGASAPGPPKDVDKFRAAVGAALDAQAFRVATIVIEDEVDGPGAYGGEMGQYLAELSAGCSVAHERGVRCANAGLSSSGVIWYLADYYARLGTWQESARIIAAAVDNRDIAAALNVTLGGAPPASAADVTRVLMTVKPAVDAARTLVGGWKRAGVDDVNFHWFERDENTLFEAIAVLRGASGCNDVMTDKIGERTQDEHEAESKLGDTQDLGLTRVVWFSHATNGSVSLVDAGGKLTPSGDGFLAISSTLECENAP